MNKDLLRKIDLGQPFWSFWVISSVAQSCPTLCLGNTHMAISH